MKCKCIAKVNKKLKASNARIAQLMAIDFDRNRATMSGPLVMLEKLDSSKRKALPSLVAAYCPFCGHQVEQS